MAELVSIVLPVHNQADHIEEVVRSHVDRLANLGAPHELLLVPNACRDRSEQVCDALAADLPSVRVVPLTEGGWGVAVQAGLAAARGDVLCYTNSARTTSQDLLLLLLYALCWPEVVVKANRRVRERLLRRFGSLLYNLECRSLFDLSCWDVNGTPKVFPRRFESLLRLRRRDDLIDAEFCAVCRQENYPMIEVPIFSSRRYGGRSTTNVGSAVRMYSGVLQARRRGW